MLSRTIVAEPLAAESLISVPDPLATALRPGPVASGAEVARALAWSLRPDEDAALPPPWLLPHQLHGFRRVLAALRRYGGALLADPVGSGKTYIALAIAAALGRSPAACLAPAPLVGQWRLTATRLGVPIVVGSHQQASRGHLPPTDRGLVIIDESHHFRHQHTQRYRYVAPWLVGRPTLMLTATPVVNRLDDLAAQLLLGVRSDALALEGVVSLRALLADGRSSPALGRLVFETARAGKRPERIERVSVAHTEEHIEAEASLTIVEKLRLSRHSAVATLIRDVLYGAAASSPAALAGALRRYRTLLLHARDAAAAGRVADRALIRRFTAEQEEQLVLWQLVSDTEGSMDLDLADLNEIDAMIQVADRAGDTDDGKVKRLRAVIADRRPTLIFTTRRATVRYLRDRLAPEPIAWCTGARAGVRHIAMPRDVVWGWFGSASVPETVPRLLITTDVAAEGLDLRRVERVVHYDLPYTPMRLEQREGRAIRLGSEHRAVEVVRLAAPLPIEQRLGQTAILARKAKLPAAAGLGRDGGSHWRWRTEVAERYEQGSRCAGVACVPAAPAGVLAGYAINGVIATLMWLDRATGQWTEDPAIVSARLTQATACSAVHPVGDHTLREAMSRLAEPIRTRLAVAAGRRWSIPETGGAARELTIRLREHVLAAARRRDVATLQRLDQTLRFLAGGHTAGEELRIEAMATQTEADLAMAIARLPLRRPPDADMELRLTGIVLFEPE